MSLAWALRLLFFVFANVAGWKILTRLVPKAERRGFRIALISGAFLAISPWVLPMLMGLGFLGEIPVVGGALKLWGAFWLVTLFALITFGGFFLLLRRSAPWLEKRSADGPENPSRRAFFQKVGMAVPVAAAVTGAAGVTGGMRKFTVKREEFRVAGLPKALDGFRIGQLTDVHVGPFIHTSIVADAVRALDAEGVDVQVMTGDLIDDLSQLRACMSALDGVKARHGMYAILGNHEYFRGIDEIHAAYEGLEKGAGRVRLLVDENAAIEHEGASIRIVGVDYPMGMPGARNEMMQASAKVAFQGCAAGDTVVCLSHHPDFFPVAAGKGAHLTLSGHTHGGQIAVAGRSWVSGIFRYPLGRYAIDGRHLYVSGGTGHWLPLRIGVPAEVTVLTLRAA